MSKTTDSLRRIWILNFFRRIFHASQYYNPFYWKIVKWGFKSREDTNYTYDLTEDNIKYLAQTISLVAKIDYNKALLYIKEPQSDEALIFTIKNAISSSPFKKFADKEIRFGRRLGWYAIARALKPKVIIEAGVDKGLGAILLCAAILKNREEGFDGRYYGTDINPDAGFLLTGKYENAGKILYGDSIKTLSEFYEKIDLFISDSDHSSDYEYREYMAIKSKLSDNSILLGDDSHCNRWLSDFSVETGRKFLFFKDFPKDHWYPGAGIGISFK